MGGASTQIRNQQRTLVQEDEALPEQLYLKWPGVHHGKESSQRG